MARLTAHFGLPDDVPFLNVDIDHDTPAFLCPFTIRFLAKHDRQAASFVGSLDSFMGVVTELLTSTRGDDYDSASQLLSQFREPWELRLGYTRSGCDGHGAADVLGARLTHTLSTDMEAFIRVNMLQRMEDIQVFVNGVGNDVVSDMAGRVGLDVLVSFTVEMMAQYPQLACGPEGATVHSYRSWDGGQRAWADKTAVLPQAGGRVLILVPALWADSNPIVSKVRFLDLTSMAVLQKNAADLDGKWTSRADLKKAERPFSAADINLRVARAELEHHGRNIVQHFHSAAMLTLQRRLGLIA